MLISHSYSLSVLQSYSWSLWIEASFRWEEIVLVESGDLKKKQKINEMTPQQRDPLLQSCYLHQVMLEFFRFRTILGKAGDYIERTKGPELKGQRLLTLPLISLSVRWHR